MGPGGRLFAGSVLGVLAVFLLITIGLQAIPPPTPATAAPAVAAPAATATVASAPAAASGGGTTINATEKDFAIALDQSSVPAGSVTFKATNQGPSPHNIAVKELNMKSPDIDAGKTGQLTVNLSPGTYTIICEIPGHEQLGMTMKLTVK